MSKSERIEAIRKACIEANPEIVELKFGCEISLEDGWNIKITGSRGTNHMLCVDELGWRYYAFMSDNKVEYVTPNASGEKKLKVIEIIGRPIRLADVLLAISKRGNWDGPFGNNSRIELYENSDFIGFPTSGKGEVLWYLGKPLIEQSEETIDFIHGLLK